MKKERLLKLVTDMSKVSGTGRAGGDTREGGAKVLEEIRDLLVYLQSLSIEGSEERSMKYNFGIETAIQNVEEAQEAASM